MRGAPWKALTQQAPTRKRSVAKFRLRPHGCGIGGAKALGDKIRRITAMPCARAFDSTAAEIAKACVNLRSRKIEVSEMGLRRFAFATSY